MDKQRIKGCVQWIFRRNFYGFILLRDFTKFSRNENWSNFQLKDFLSIKTQGGKHMIKTIKFFSYNSS